MNPKSKYPRKYYVYRCKCGKDTMCGSIQTDPETERKTFDEVLDIKFTELHNRPGCGIRDKVVAELKPKRE